FGDMMSLLLTFFIMLVSMSEIKEEERYQAMVESIRKQFGHDASDASLIPGDIRPRNSTIQEHVHAHGRAKRKDTAEGGQEVQSVTGESKRVRIVRPGDDSSSGGVIFFDEGSAKLSEANKRHLVRIVQQLAGKPQKVEIRGHTSRRPISPKSGYRDRMDLSFERCRATRKFLIEEGIEPARIRLSAAGATEPLYSGINVEKLKRNARVEILMWDERVHDLTDGEVK
ncbi:MAG: OmpA family protein, partial [Planctomycetota bacterium]